MKLYHLFACSLSWFLVVHILEEDNTLCRFINPIFSFHRWRRAVACPWSHSSSVKKTGQEPGALIPYRVLFSFQHDGLTLSHSWFLPFLSPIPYTLPFVVCTWQFSVNLSWGRRAVKERNWSAWSLRFAIIVGQETIKCISHFKSESNLQHTLTLHTHTHTLRLLRSISLIKHCVRQEFLTACKGEVIDFKREHLVKDTYTFQKLFR